MITYHRATPEDVRRALDLVESVWIKFNLKDNEPGALETMRSDITQNKDIAEKYASGRATMFVATDEDNIVGVIGADNRGYIRLLFIDGAFHRKSIATELMNRMICELKRCGFNTIKLNSSRFGLPFYKKYGFLETGIEQDQNGFLITPLEYTPNEIWDVLDEHGNRTGRYAERGRKMAHGDYHLVVHVWKHNIKGEWLIDRRTPRYGNGDLDGKWETTGGSAVSGDDSLSAALRETKEELGIELDPGKGTLFKRSSRLGDNGHTWFEDVWIFEYDKPIESVAFDGSEVCDAMWATAVKIREMMASGEFLSEYFYPYFNEMVESNQFVDEIKEISNE